MPLNSQNLRTSFRRLLKRHQSLIGTVLFVFGLGLLLASSEFTGIAWRFLGTLGAFVAGAVAIPFIYERFIKAEDRQLFLSDLDNVLERRFGEKLMEPFIHERGRISLDHKVSLIKTAKVEVIEVGLSLRTSASYFVSRPSQEFRLQFANILKRGVNFKYILLDPDREIAKLVAQDRREPHLVDNIQSSIDTFSTLRDEFRDQDYKGVLRIFTYESLPYCYAMVIDPNEEDGKALISPYMYETKRADAPYIEIHKSVSPDLFKTVSTMVNSLLAASREI